tara:strand:+ start:42 stop:233 length:192 start_codon:yes stop_codon:yes gene_type:complete
MATTSSVVLPISRKIYLNVVGFNNFDVEIVDPPQVTEYAFTNDGGYNTNNIYNINQIINVGVA